MLQGKVCFIPYLPFIIHRFVICVAVATKKKMTWSTVCVHFLGWSIFILCIMWNVCHCYSLSVLWQTTASECFFFKKCLKCYAFSRRLLTELESFKPTAEVKGKASEASKDHILYELYYRPEQAQFTKSAKASFCTFLKAFTCKFKEILKSIILGFKTWCESFLL